MPGAGHPFCSEHGKSFNLLLKELRATFHKEQKRGTRLYLTIAAGASDDFLAHTQMAEGQGYLDTVNLMGYDYYELSYLPIIRGSLDPVSCVPWLYNAEKRIFVSYEDVESLTRKCQYVRIRKLAGIKFWQYTNDNGAPQGH